MWVDEWSWQAACRDSQPDTLFVKGAEHNKAKQVCSTCRVRSECLAEALENHIEWGVWGGMTERERRALIRNNPGASWRDVLRAAKSADTRVGV
jgi:WhiB family redox-sensing transcriptional regulator